MRRMHRRNGWITIRRIRSTNRSRATSPCTPTSASRAAAPVARGDDPIGRRGPRTQFAAVCRLRGGGSAQRIRAGELTVDGPLIDPLSHSHHRLLRFAQPPTRWCPQRPVVPLPRRRSETSFDGHFANPQRSARQRGARSGSVLMPKCCRNTRPAACIPDMPCTPGPGGVAAEHK